MTSTHRFAPKIDAWLATRSPLSRPALSLDRLRIRYGKNRSMLVSPLAKAQFIAALLLGERKDRQ